MKKAWNFLEVAVGLILLGALALGLVVAFRVVSGSGAVGALATTPQGYPPPQATGPATQPPQGYPPPQATVAIPTPLPNIEPPTPTFPPVPTLLPTPVVTSIPAALFPVIPEVVGKVPQPFWIIYWQGNEVWRVDDQGKEQQLLFDTYNSLGQWLTAHPMEGSDCCWSGQRVVVSPDGQKLALVVVDKDKLSYKGEPFTFSIYVLDIQTGDLKLISKGVQPVWSPDSKRIAFGSEQGLWIADLETNQVSPVVTKDPATSELEVRYWAWSLDGKQIAYRYGEGMIDKPELWIKSVVGESSPQTVPNIPADLYYGCGSWMPDGQHLLCYAQDWVAPGHPSNLWSVSITTGERRQLTRDLFAYGGQWSPDGRWLAFSAISLYEQEEQPYDIWLLSADGAKLLRVTSAPPQDNFGYWSPDGTRLVFLREGNGLAILSLETGEVTSLDVSLPYDSRFNYARGGSK